jgi:putative endonuclease
MARDTIAACVTVPATSSGFISYPAAQGRSMSASPAIFARRIHQHKIDSIEGFTEKHQVHRLVYYEAFDHVLNAIFWEKQLKGWRRQKKIALVETTNPQWQDLAEQWGREMRFRGQSLGRTS